MLRWTCLISPTLLTTPATCPGRPPEVATHAGTSPSPMAPAANFCTPNFLSNVMSYMIVDRDVS
eukprot:1722445-Pyramimonas_sp.AAC.1